MEKATLSSLDTHQIPLSNYPDVYTVKRKALDNTSESPFSDKQSIGDILKHTGEEINKIVCKNYNFTYSNAIIYALGETRSHLNFRMRSQSTIFSDLLKDHTFISKSKIKSGDIVVYFNKENESDTPDGDKIYHHMGIVQENIKLIRSQFGEGTLGIYEHHVAEIFSSYGDYIAFMRKISTEQNKI